MVLCWHSKWLLLLMIKVYMQSITVDVIIIGNAVIVIVGSGICQTIESLETAVKMDDYVLTATVLLTVEEFCNFFGTL